LAVVDERAVNRSTDRAETNGRKDYQRSVFHRRLHAVASPVADIHAAGEKPPRTSRRGARIEVRGYYSARHVDEQTHARAVEVLRTVYSRRSC